MTLSIVIIINDNDNITKTLNNHGDNSICLLV